MVSLVYHDEHVAWQQRVQKEINEAFKFQSTYTEPLRPCFSPPRAQKPRVYHKSRAKSVVYSSLPSANINLSALNVYAEVRGKYSRNANKTLNSIPKTNGILTRPSTAGSLKGYSQRSHEKTEEKVVKVEEKKRFNEETFKLRNVSKNEAVEEAEIKVEDEITDEGKEFEEIEERETDLSVKTSSSQQRYIEELEKLLREERIKRIKAEEKLERLTSKKSRRQVRIVE